MLINAMKNTPDALTTNGDVAFSSTYNHVLDAFARSSTASVDETADMFRLALAEDANLAVKLAFWLRCPRTGAGRRANGRRAFVEILKYLHSQDPERAAIAVSLLPKYGRWDDVLAIAMDKQVPEPVRDYAFIVFMEAIRNQDRLACKWAPRKGPVASELRRRLRWSPRIYRQIIVSGSKTVEQDMCAKQWDQINYEHVPSIAAKRYQSAFKRNDETRYQEYQDQVTAGQKKVNARVIAPYQILQNWQKSDNNRQASVNQWNSLPDFLETDKTFLPMIDVSGSMHVRVPGTSADAMTIALGLGLYLAEKQTGAFKDHVLTFTNVPRLFHLVGDVFNRMAELTHYNNVGYNTNIDKAFEHVLTAAKLHKLTQADMPDGIVIFSDMQFDMVSQETPLALHDRWKPRFEAIGLQMPVLVYWNLAPAFNTLPVSEKTPGALLASGFSPTLMKNLFKLKTQTPIEGLLEVLKDFPCP